MNQSQLNKIFQEPPEGLPRERMEAYLEGRLDAKGQHEVEMRLQGCGLSAEALEGFEANPSAVAALPEMRDQVRKMTGETSWWNRALVKGVLGGGAGALIVWLGFNLYQPEEQLLQTTTIDSVAVQVPVLEQENFLQASHPEESVVEPTISEESALPVSEPHSSEEKEAKTELPDDPIAEPVPVSNVEPLPQKSQPDPEPEKTVEEHMAYAYMAGFKIYDYSEEYDNEVEEKVPTLGGSLPANFENRDQMKAEESEWRTVSHQYEDLLELGIAHLEAKKFRKALEKFRLILTTFPEDQNALFYSGFCHHRMRRYSKATLAFDLVLDNSNNTFHEEALWYKALSLMYDHDWPMAKVLFEEIEEGEGFYSEKATEMLRKKRKK